MTTSPSAWSLRCGEYRARARSSGFQTSVSAVAVRFPPLSLRGAILLDASVGNTEAKLVCEIMSQGGREPRLATPARGKATEPHLLSYISGEEEVKDSIFSSMEAIRLP